LYFTNQQAERISNKMFILFYFQKNAKNIKIYFAVTKVIYIFTATNKGNSRTPDHKVGKQKLAK